jgi:hypothetical protein
MQPGWFYSAQGSGTTSTANFGSTTYASALSSTSRLSYWIYPMTPLGQESGTSSMTGLNSTCAAVDIIFTDGTARRNLGVKDQFGNTLNPASECSHSQPD